MPLVARALASLRNGYHRESAVWRVAVVVAALFVVPVALGVGLAYELVRRVDRGRLAPRAQWATAVVLFAAVITGLSAVGSSTTPAHVTRNAALGEMSKVSTSRLVETVTPRPAITAAAMVAASPTSTPSQSVATTRPTPSPAPTATPTPSPTATRTPSPLPATPRPTARPTPKPTPRPTPRPAPTAPAGVFGNPWGYNFTPGALIYSPPLNFCDYFNCIPSFWESTKGYVMQCKDAMFSHSGGRSGSCSYHGGNWRPLYKH